MSEQYHERAMLRTSRNLLDPQAANCLSALAGDPAPESPPSAQRGLRDTRDIRLVRALNCEPESCVPQQGSDSGTHQYVAYEMHPDNNP